MTGGGRRRRFAGAISAVALVLLVEAVVGQVGTLLAFTLAVVISLWGRVGRPLLLVGAAVVLTADAVVLGPMAVASPSAMVMWGRLAVWALAGLLIRGLVIEVRVMAAGRAASGAAPPLPPATGRGGLGRLGLLLESSTESKERLRLMVEGIRDYAIVMLNPAGRIVSWNKGAERILGYTAAEIRGRSHARLYLSQDVRSGLPRRNLEEAIAEGAFQVEGWRRAKDGRRLWANVGLTALREGSESLRGFAMIVRDITQQKRAEESLRRAHGELGVRVQERTAQLAAANQALQSEVLERIQAQEVLRQQSSVLRSILDSIGDAIVVVEGPCRPLISNPAAQRLFGFGPEPVLIDPGRFSSSIGIMGPPGEPAGDAARRLDRALQGEVVDDLELTVRPPGTDQERWLLASGRPLQDPDGAQDGAVVVFRDITERRRDALELRQARDAAETASRAKDQLLAVLSHELRTPLTPVLLAVSDLMAKTGLNPEVRSTLAMIRRNVEVESRLIDDLLDLTRASTGRLSLDLTSVDGHRIIQHAAEVCRAELDGNQIGLRLELAAARHQVLADPARLQQVFWNLIQNAVKFTPSGGRITVRTRNTAGPDPADPHAGWLAEVTDTGIGIEPDRLPRIFNAFEQRDPVSRRRYGGLGLGLAISRSVVEAHGGQLTAFSAGANQGSSFTLVLAAQPGSVPSEPVSDPPPPPRREPQPGSPGLRVLLIEDNTDTLNYIARLLRQRGHLVRTAPDFHQARQLANAEGFDLIISDIELPDGSGLELIREVNRIRPTPAIALSGFGSADDIDLSRDAGFTEHLIKPVGLRDLETAIARVAPRPVEDRPPGNPASPGSLGTIPAPSRHSSTRTTGLEPKPSGLLVGLDARINESGEDSHTRESRHP